MSKGGKLYEAIDKQGRCWVFLEPQYLVEINRAVRVAGGHSGLRQAISVGPHRLLADEPEASDEGPDPYELLLSALGSCTNMTLRMYADRKKWPLKEIRVALTHSKKHANGCLNCEQPAAMLDRIDRRITLTGELSAEQRQRLLEIANLCPVHKTLTSRVDIQTELVSPSV
jgi:putative redox protein